MSRFVIRLKAIEYNENFFYYLFSYFSDLDLQLSCLLTLFFQLYIFKILYLWQNTFVYSSFRSQIHFNNLNLYLLSLLLTQ